MTEVLDVFLRTGPAGTAERYVERTQATLTRGLTLEAFTSTMIRGPRRQVVQGTLLGDSLLVWETADAAGRRVDTVRTAAGRLALRATLPLLAAFDGRRRPGAARRLVLALPRDRRLAPALLRFEAESLVVVHDSAVAEPGGGWRLVETDTVPALRTTVQVDGTTRTAWLDADGLLAGGEVLPGAVLERTAFEPLNALLRAVVAAPESLVRVPAVAPLAERPPAPSRLAVVVRGAAARRLPVTDQPGRLAGDTLALGGVAVPQEPDTAGVSSPDGLVPSADPAIVALAGEIGRGRDDALALAGRFARWTAGRIARTPLPVGPADARRVLALRRGDAAEHALLFTALARAAGLTARPVAGLVLDASGAWRRHAWAEVWDGGWVAVDPTFGTAPAGAAYLRLAAPSAGAALDIIPRALLLAPARPSGGSPR